jgi:hypothetical protein
VGVLRQQRSAGVGDHVLPTSRPRYRFGLCRVGERPADPVVRTSPAAVQRLGALVVPSPRMIHNVAQRLSKRPLPTVSKELQDGKS